MTAFLIRRLLQSAALLLIVTTASFFLVRLTPGGPEAALINNPRLGPDQIERLRQRFGLDDPLGVQYLRWVGSVAHLDFGLSYTYARPATEVIGERLWPTIQLGLLATRSLCSASRWAPTPRFTADSRATRWSGWRRRSATPCRPGGSG